MRQRLKQLNQLTENDLFLKSASKKRLRWLMWLVLTILALIVTRQVLFLSQKNNIIILKIPFAQQSLTAPKFYNPASIFYQAEATDQINILILGVPGQGHIGPELTDTILLAIIKPQAQTLRLISLPRDLLVKIPNQTAQIKINSLYSLEKDNLSLIRQKIEEISGLHLKAYILIDLRIVERLIDQIGGLNLFIPEDIFDPRFPGPAYSYQTFEIKKGWRHLDGLTALRYIRTRHAPAGDFGRMERQQQVLVAIKNKLSSLSIIFDLPEFIDIIKTFSAHLKTDLNTLEIWRLWNLGKNISNDNIYKYTIDEKFLIADKIYLGSDEASVLTPRLGQDNYLEIQKYIQNL